MSPIFFTSPTRSAVCVLPGVFNVFPSAVTVNGAPLNIAEDAVDLPVVDQRSGDAVAAFAAPGQLVDEGHLERVRPVAVGERPIAILNLRSGNLVVGSQRLRAAEGVMPLEQQALGKRPRDAHLQRVVRRLPIWRIDLDVELTPVRREIRAIRVAAADVLHVVDVDRLTFGGRQAADQPVADVGDDPPTRSAGVRRSNATFHECVRPRCVDSGTAVCMP